MRVPHAAKTLSRQLGERYKSHTMEPSGDPDGIGVHRKVKFDKTSSKFLDKVLPYIDDPRIVNHSMRSGILTVEFSHRTVADQRDVFPLDDADTVATAEAKNPSTSSGDEGDGDAD
jgi:hypothetical protein